MGREELEEVWEIGDPLEDAAVEFAGEPPPGFRPQQVRPTDVANEEEIASEQDPGRILAPRPVEQRKAHVLRRVSRRAQRLEAQASEADLVTLTDHGVGVGWRPFGAAEPRAVDARLVRQPSLELHSAADEVGVNMGLEDVGDAQALLPCQTHVRLDIAGGVDDGAPARGFVADHVGVDSKARDEATVQEHGDDPSWR